MDWLGGKRTKDMLTEGRTKDRCIKAKKIKDGNSVTFAAKSKPYSKMFLHSPDNLVYHKLY